MLAIDLLLLAVGFNAAGSWSAPTASSSSLQRRAGHDHDHDHDWAQGAVTEWPIHESCNATEHNQLSKALDDAVTLASHATDHILRWGRASEHFQKYFGSEATAEVIGWYEKVTRGDRANVLFRCDDPDDNCRLDGWGGHWRGENATGETVICPLSYETRHDLAQMCALGYNVAEYEYNFYFASDLLHRFYHMPAMSEGVVEHYSEDHATTLELAIEDPAKAVQNFESFLFFALEVYAFDIAVPGVGCPGEEVMVESSPRTRSTDLAGSSMSPPTTMETSTTTMPTPSYADAAAMTSSAAAECHTHADGTEHCE